MTRKKYLSTKIYYENNKEEICAMGGLWRENNNHKLKKYRKTIRNESRRIMKELKFNGCAICGYSKCGFSLDFHHVNPNKKKFGLNECNICHRKTDVIISELQKYILLCKNCHGELEYVKT